MAYDRHLEQRLDKTVAGRRDIQPKKMFGGVGYLLRGNMCFGIYKDYLIIRIGEEQAARAFKTKGTRPFDITGRAMKGWVMVAPEAMKTAPSLTKWVDQAVKFVAKMPRK